MNSYTLNLSSYNTQGNYTLPKLYFEDHTRLTLNLEHIPETYIPLYMKIDWGFGDVELHDNDLLLSKLNKLNFLQYSSLLNTEYNFEYYPSETSLYKELSAQVFIKYSNGDKLKFLIPIQVRTYGFLESLGSVSLINTNIIPNYISGSEHQLKAKVEEYLFELRSNRKKEIVNTGDVAALIESYASEGERIPAGIYYVDRTITLNDNDKLILTEGVEIKTNHTSVGILIDGNNISILGGVISGHIPIPFSKASDGTWESYQSDWPFEISSSFGDKWANSGLTKNGISIPVSSWPYNGIRGAADPSKWDKTQLFTQSELPEWNDGVCYSSILNGWYYWATTGTNCMGESQYNNIIANQENPWKLYSGRSFLQPGTYCYMRNPHKIVYMPLPGETLDDFTFSVRRPSNIIKIVGDSSLLENISIQDTIITGTDFLYPYWGSLSGEGDWSNTAIDYSGVTIQKASVSIKKSIIEKTGGYGLHIGEGADGCVIENCLIQESNTNLVRIGQENTGEEVTNTTIQNCHITTSGLRSWSGVGVIAGKVDGLSLLSNHIENTAYTGIKLGHDWVGNVTINKNHIHNILHKCQDGGAIQIFSIHSNNSVLISENYVHNAHLLIKNSTLGSCLMIDSGSGNVVTKDNLFSADYPNQWVVKLNYYRRCWHFGMKTRTDKSWPIGMNGDTNWTHGTVEPFQRTATQNAIDNGDGTASIWIKTDNLQMYGGRDNPVWNVKAKEEIDGVRYLLLDGGIVPTNRKFGGKYYYYSGGEREGVAFPDMRQELILDTNTSFLIDRWYQDGEADYTMEAIDNANGVQRIRVPSTFSDADYSAIPVGAKAYTMICGAQRSSDYIYGGRWFVVPAEGIKEGVGFKIKSYEVVDFTEVKVIVELDDYPPIGDDKIDGNDSVVGIKSGEKLSYLGHYYENVEMLTQDEFDTESDQWLLSNPNPIVPQSQ